MMPAGGRLPWFHYLAEKPAYPVPVNLAASSQLLVSGRAILKGYSLYNNNATAGVLTIYDGMDAKGTVAGEQGYTSGGNLAQTWGTYGVMLVEGLYVTVATGGLVGAFLVSYFKPEDEPWYFGIVDQAQEGGPGGRGSPALRTADTSWHPGSQPGIHQPDYARAQGTADRLAGSPGA